MESLRKEEMNKGDYIEYEYSKLSHLFDGQLILLVTVTELEIDEVRSKLVALDGYDAVLKVFEDKYTYYIGKFGKYGVALVQTGNMGSMGVGGSTLAVSNALDKIKAKIVIMIGIAFGVDDERQNIGDVLISETIIPYNLIRVGKDETTHRGIEKQSSMVLFNRFKNITTWEYQIENGDKAKTIEGKVLSGEELIDNKSRRDELLNVYPDAKGGEMEGAGVAGSCEDRADWILVKGICDFADGEKGKDKSKRQKIAIESAVSLCLELFASETAFIVKGISPFCKDVVLKNDISLVNINDVLFEVYDEKKESYYTERKEDDKFNEIILRYGIWIYGDTGTGKTNLILRNLMKSKKEYISITLGSCVNGKKMDLFNELLNCIQEKTKSNSQYPNHKSFPPCCRAIQAELESYYKHKSVIVYIDEIPISLDSEYREFVKYLFALINSIQLINGLDEVQFVLSSIHNPTTHIQRNDQKIHQYMCFCQLTYWGDEAIDTLINLILTELHFVLPQDIKDKLNERAKGSPRFIKKFFKNMSLSNDYSQETLFQKIEDTDNELKQFINE